MSTTTNDGTRPVTNAAMLTNAIQGAIDNV